MATIRKIKAKVKANSLEQDSQEPRLKLLHKSMQRNFTYQMQNYIRTSKFWITIPGIDLEVALFSSIRM
jgi:hypothetical protein